MSDEKQPEIVQLNLASEQRTAGRDYFEIFVVPKSMKIFLATQTTAELDRLALENERLFCYRFGFEPNRAIRQQVLALKQKHDLTDREIRGLRRSGQMTIKHSEAKMSPARFYPIVGWVQLALLSLIYLPLLLVILVSPVPDWKRTLEVLLVASLWFLGAWILNAMYIEPWRVIKRTQAKSGTSQTM